MPKIQLMPSGKILEVKEGTLLSDALRLAEVKMDFSCGGNGTCGKCKVEVSPINAVETDLPHGDTWVLSCHAYVKDDLTVYVREQKEVVVLSDGMGEEVPLCPNVAAKDGEDLLGLAVDVGTTTVAANLVDLKSGNILSTESFLNPQTKFSGDVIGRIEAAKEQGTALLTDTLWNALGEMTERMLRKTGKEAKFLKEAVVCANTVMQHLAMGISPESLGYYPYTPENFGNESMDAPLKEMSDSATVYYPSVISGYVGSDITAGILASGLLREEKTSLFVDIGTNGEMVLAANGKLYATSTAAGPAFEGGNIRFGMRASEGAIQRVNEDFSFETIGNTTPVGICGSGLFDLTARLVEQGIIDESGFLDVSTEYEGEAAFALTRDIYLTAKDVRQVQLAKGAIRAGVTALLSEVGIKAEEVEQIFIAGAFGYHLKEESLLSIGLLPAAFRGKITYVGNTALSGATMMLKNAPLREKIAQKVKEIQTVDLSMRADFSMLFAESMMFFEE